MPVKISKDLAAALMFIALGIAAYYIGSGYNMGTPQRPGTGVLPRILAWCLMGTGALLAIQSQLTSGPKLEAWALRPLIAVTLATVAFSQLIDRVGLVVTMIVSMTIVAFGTPETRWREFAMFMVLMLAIGLGIFIYGLGMPLKVWPWN